MLDEGTSVKRIFPFFHLFLSAGEEQLHLARLWRGLFATIKTFKNTLLILCEHEETTGLQAEGKRVEAGEQPDEQDTKHCNRTL